ncbi:MAG: DsbA family protein [Aquisalimonadaceae bacterium]
MMDRQTTPRVPVTLFFDYNCPFCYVASYRLERLNQRYDMDILWRFVEIHPENPAAGKPLADLGYDPARWQVMMENLRRMVEEDGLPWGDRTFTTNTRQAILLAQMTSIMHPEKFLPLHRAIFHAYFADGRNIGDELVLRDLAAEHGLEDVLPHAWESPQAIKVLLSHVEAAQQLGLTGVPTLVVANRPFSGAVSMEILEQALQEQHQ